MSDFIKDLIFIKNLSRIRDREETIEALARKYIQHMTAKQVKSAVLEHIIEGMSDATEDELFDAAYDLDVDISPFIHKDH